jgi:hypothetical protein
MSITVVRSRVTARLAALYVLAALVAAVAAILLSQAGGRRPQIASAASHCTRYAASISQDVNCFTFGIIASGGFYATPSVALRDYNEISLNASRSWFLSYDGGNGAAVGGTGSSGIMFTSGGYAQARCSITGSSTTGYCTTGWHD